MCVCTHAVLLRVSRTHVSDVYDNQRGPLQACGPCYRALLPSGMQCPTRKPVLVIWQPRTMWNIPLDHLLFLRSQVHCSLPPGGGTLLTASTQALFNKSHLHFSLSPFGTEKCCWCRASRRNSRDVFTTRHMAFPAGAVLTANCNSPQSLK